MGLRGIQKDFRLPEVTLREIRNGFRLPEVTLREIQKDFRLPEATLRGIRRISGCRKQFCVEFGRISGCSKRFCVEFGRTSGCRKRFCVEFGRTSGCPSSRFCSLQHCMTPKKRALLQDCLGNRTAIRHGACQRENCSRHIGEAMAIRRRHSADAPPVDAGAHACGGTRRYVRHGHPYG